MMTAEKSTQVAISMYISLANNKIIISDQEINYEKQIEGLGEVSNIETIQIDTNNIIDKNSSGSFKLDIILKIKSNNYSYSNIYKISEIPNNNIIFLGNIGLVENIKQEDIEIIATITNII
ncbi:hypothetical protein [uncultured Clostridium sp.]|uniref:hypothetical protein n=1 Tax=uncultured Clostridium sp. TaxID=59620 RepID=UPI0026230A8D|nr:hypothetical protein [uncultured Clostridium sp.]